jgi:hypothetical protein
MYGHTIYTRAQFLSLQYFFWHLTLLKHVGQIEIVLLCVWFVQ